MMLSGTSSPHVFFLFPSLVPVNQGFPAWGPDKKWRSRGASQGWVRSVCFITPAKSLLPCKVIYYRFQELGCGPLATLVVMVIILPTTPCIIPSPSGASCTWDSPMPLMTGHGEEEVLSDTIFLPNAGNCLSSSMQLPHVGQGHQVRPTARPPHHLRDSSEKRIKQMVCYMTQ